MSMKTVVVVEDEAPQRDNLVTALRLRDFDAIGAGTIREARDVTRRLGDKIDVMVLDMRFDLDPAAGSTTGADVGIEVASRLKWPPESLILTAHETVVPFYQAALHLRAASYMSKLKVKQNDVITHVRALALRRALSARPETMDKITSIAENSRDAAEALRTFCRQLLIPELESCLGTPFVVLMTEGNETSKCGGSATLPEGADAAYHVVQSLAHGDANLTEPFVFDPSRLNPEQQDPATRDIYERLRGGAFLPLPVSRDLLLSIGILEAGVETGKYKLAENPRQLGAVLASYFRPAVLEFLLTLLSRLTEFSAERKTVLRETSRFCLYVGQEQLAILADALEAGEVKRESEFFRRMKALATDLRSTGELLLPLAVEDKEAAGENAPEEGAAPRPLPIADVVREAWEDVAEQFSVEGMSLDVHADEPVEVEAGHDDVFLAVSRLFQWTVQRKMSTPVGVKPSIFVSYERNDDRAEIVIEDRSRRLGKYLRGHLFEPFNQPAPPPTWEPRGGAPPDDAKAPKPGLYLPLYLAKMLVEMKCHGKLQDSSDVMGGEVGHRFVMSLPLYEPKSKGKGA